MLKETEIIAPSLLISVPHLKPKNGQQTVLLLLEHTPEGSMGLILNRPTNISIDTFCASQNMKFQGQNEEPLHQGGPVQADRAFILHNSPHEGPETELIFNDIKLSYSLESLAMLSHDPPPSFRVYLGYTSWGPGRLASEVANGIWLLAEPNTHLLFHVRSEEMWKDALKILNIDPLRLSSSKDIN